MKINYHIVFALTAFLLAGSNQLHSQQDACRDILLAKTIEVTKNTTISKLAWMRLIDQSNYSEHKESASAFVPGYFNGSYDSFSQKRQTLFLQENYDQSIFEAEQELRIFLRSDAIEGWKTCMSSKNDPFKTWIEVIDEKSGIVAIMWTPPPGLQGALDVTFFINGAKENIEITELNVGTTRLLLTRKSNNSVIKGVINGVINNAGSYSTNIYLPKISEELLLPSPDEPTPIVICSCKAGDGLEGNIFWGPKGEYCCGTNRYGKYLNNCKEVTELGFGSPTKGGLASYTFWGPVGESVLGNMEFGTYGGPVLRVSRTKVPGAYSYCKAVGAGGLAEREFWGPKGQHCLGVGSWPKYNSGQNCFD